MRVAHEPDDPDVEGLSGRWATTLSRERKIRPKAEMYFFVHVVLVNPLYAILRASVVRHIVIDSVDGV